MDRSETRINGSIQNPDRWIDPKPGSLHPLGFNRSKAQVDGLTQNPNRPIDPSSMAFDQSMQNPDRLIYRCKTQIG
jgi:hypothetical protein